MNIPHRAGPLDRGFTLIELMIVIAIGGLLVLLVAPSFQDMILKQRLRGVNAQLVTDMQYARSEAVARGQIVRVIVGQDASQTCYTLYTSLGNNGGWRCDCLLGAGSACTAPESSELKTVNLPRSQKVLLDWPATQDVGFGYESVRGGLVSIPSDLITVPLQEVTLDTLIDSSRNLRTRLVQSGRPTVCTSRPDVMHVTACPP